MAVPAYPADEEPTGLAFESCTIARWRGFVTSSFVAVLEDGTPVAESASFRARGEAAPPETRAARSAFDELRAELGRQGWDPSANPAETWYAARFTRPVAVAVPVVEPAPPHLAPPQRAPAPQLPPPQPAPPQIELPAAAAPPARAEPPELPPTAEQAAGGSRPSRPVVVVSTLGIAAAIALGGYLEFGPSGRHASRLPSTPVSVPRPPKLFAPKQKRAATALSAPKQKRAATAPVSAPAPKPATVRVDISAKSRASWLEIRRGSATGPVLFTGELAPGRHLHLAGKRLWARFGAASNLTIRVDGRPITFTGTYEHVFTAAKK